MMSFTDEEWEGYLICARLPGLANNGLWIDLMTLIWQIANNHTLPHEKMHWRGSLDIFDHEGTTYSNDYVIQARHPANSVSYEAFQNRLANAFNVAVENISYDIDTLTVVARPTTYATYKYNAVSRFRLAVMGCASMEELCTLEQSRIETAGYIYDPSRIGNWEPAV